MDGSKPIIIIEDDQDDQDIISEALKDLGVKNRLSFFSRCQSALTYLKTTPETPFLILCDINLPEMTGLELKKLIDENETLKQKAIPFVFFSTTADQRTVQEAYTKTTIQGFFQKKGRYEELKEVLKTIIKYWNICKHPSAFNQHA